MCKIAPARVSPIRYTRGIKKENRQRSAAKVKRMLLSILKPPIRMTIQ